MFATVVLAHWKELLSAAYIGSIILVLTAWFVFMMEQQEKDTKFLSMADSLWWAFITFYSVGYGDMSPTTWQGKAIASGCTVLGIIFFGLPAGIIGAGLALQVPSLENLPKLPILQAQQMKREAHQGKRRAPAAALIQSLWRLGATRYIASSHCLKAVTWGGRSFAQRLQIATIAMFYGTK